MLLDLTEICQYVEIHVFEAAKHNLLLWIKKMQILVQKSRPHYVLCFMCEQDFTFKISSTFFVEKSRSITSFLHIFNLQQNSNFV